MSVCEEVIAWLGQFCPPLLIDLVLTALLLYPLTGFIRYGWERRAEEISRILSDEAKQKYLETFHRQKVDLASAPKEFDEFYRKWYGRSYFVLPILFVLIVALVENYILAQSLQDLVKPGQTYKQFNNAAAAIAGAYTFVCWDFFARMQRRNMTRGDILRGALRLAVAVPIGFAFSALFSESLAPFAAFGIGVFPLQTIRTILQRQMKKRLEMDPAPESARESVVVLSGIDTETAERIEDADITTVTQLAWCDPIQLTMRSNLQFAYVLDIVSQALVWVYLGEKLKDLAKVGLRGAIEISQLLDDLDDGSRKTKAHAAAALKAAAGTVGIEQDALMNTFDQIAGDPITQFLKEAWE